MHCFIDSFNYKKQYVGSYEVLLTIYYTYSMILCYEQGIVIDSNIQFKKIKINRV